MDYVARKISDAAIDGDIETVRICLLADDLQQQAKDRALSLASSHGHLAIVKLLLKNGADIHSNNENSLSSAITNRKLDVVRYLVQNGAVVSFDSGQNLCWLIIFPDCDLLLYLLLVYPINHPLLIKLEVEGEVKEAEWTKIKLRRFHELSIATRQRWCSKAILRFKQDPMRTKQELFLILVGQYERLPLEKLFGKPIYLDLAHLLASRLIQVDA